MEARTCESDRQFDLLDALNIQNCKLRSMLAFHLDMQSNWDVTNSSSLQLIVVDGGRVRLMFSSRTLLSQEGSNVAPAASASKITLPNLTSCSTRRIRIPYSLLTFQSHEKEWPTRLESSRPFDARSTSTTLPQIGVSLLPRIACGYIGEESPQHLPRSLFGCHFRSLLWTSHAKLIAKGHMGLAHNLVFTVYYWYMCLLSMFCCPRKEQRKQTTIHPANASVKERENT